MKKVSKTKRNIIILIITIIYFMYIYYYYNEINFYTFAKHTVGSLNLASNEIRQFINIIIKNTKMITTVAFMMSLYIIIKYTNINKLILSLKSIQTPNIKLETNSVKELIEEDKKCSNNESVESSTEPNNNIRNKILNILIDNPEIIEIVELFINNATSIDIPLNRVPLRYKINCIDELFDKEFHSNSIRIKSIKESIKKELISVYNELLEKGLIYTELNN